MSDTIKQNALFNSVKNFLNSEDIKFVLDEESGDYLFYCYTLNGNQFTFDICGEYVEFFGEKNHDVIMYFNENYIDFTIQLINKYLNSFE